MKGVPMSMGGDMGPAVAEGPSINDITHWRGVQNVSIVLIGCVIGTVTKGEEVQKSQRFT